MAKAPKCKLCSESHWLNEPHKIVWHSGPTTARGSTLLVSPVPFHERAIGLTQVTKAASVTKPSVTGRPRKYASNAERQAAYRERKKS